MANVVACPNDEVLQQLVLGTAPSAERDSWVAHLEQCSPCAERLRKLPHDDTLIEALRTKEMTAEPKEKEAISRLVTNLCAAWSAPGPLTDSDALATVAPLPPQKDETCALAGASDDADDETQYLLPAQGPGELGRLGHYRVLRVLGAGGMGKVYEAEDTLLQRRVALKVMKASFASNAVARKRFIQEAQSAARIEHDNIVPIYQVGEDRGVPFLAMPLLAGRSLDDLLKKTGKLPLTQIVRLGGQIAEGLKAAHDRGLIHRDIKPGNIWVEPVKEGRAKILDFGLARSVAGDVHLTQSGAIVGTPAYMAPEQAQSNPVDHRCDLFSLGCVLYLMSTGELPFRGNDTMGILMALALHDPTPPHQINDDIPIELSDLVMKLLQKNPQNRIGSADEVIEALMKLENRLSGKTEATGVMHQALDLPAQARRSTKTPAKTQAQRNKIGRIAAIAASLLLLAGGAFALYEFVIKTPNGTMLVQIDDKEVEARFKNGELQILDTDGKVKHTLKPGERTKDMPPGTYRIHVVGADGLTVDVEEFTLKNGDKCTVRVKMLTEGLAKINPAKEAPKGDDPATPLKDREKPFVLVRDGKSTGEFKQLAEAEKIRHVGLGESLAFIAYGIGSHFDEIKETIEPVIGSDGRVAGVRQIAAGGGITLELEMYVGAPNPRDEIHIDGEPPLHLVVQGGTAGDVATPAILANMIPRLLEAKPGLHTMHTLGLPRYAG